MSHKPECNEKWEYDKDHCICSWIEKTEQRIIKLIQEELGAWGDVNVGSVIALIKGKNE